MMTSRSKNTMLRVLEGIFNISIFVKEIKTQRHMEKRIHIEDYSLNGGTAKVTIGYQEVDFVFTASQAIEAAIDLKFIVAPLSYDDDKIVTTHPLFPGEMSTKGIERKVTLFPSQIFRELSGDEQTELVRYLAVQQYEIHI